ncbi:hypothetical protein Tcan_18764 [Toxocara canis]|uniref:Uncharacterized protein n=1 Tax=Toxocara canis TaxID=6265 RepID=A0A0B2VRE1_TOXCA|nr:hypothetical protein Tcan_18764 [Toxocara canis]
MAQILLELLGALVTTTEGSAYSLKLIYNCVGTRRFFLGSSLRPLSTFYAFFADEIRRDDTVLCFGRRRIAGRYLNGV